jgi:hypothetical protein
MSLRFTNGDGFGLPDDAERAMRDGDYTRRCTQDPHQSSGLRRWVEAQAPGEVSRPS